jgi:hypothetical protein
MDTPNSIFEGTGRKKVIDIDAFILRNVMPFAAKNDLRYYLNGIYVLATKGDGPIVMATNGHMVYCEEASGGDASASVPLKITGAAKTHFKAGYRLQVHAFLDDDGAPRARGSILTIVDMDGDVRYIEPGTAIYEANYPDVRAVLGSFSDWKEGLTGNFDTSLLTSVMALPGWVRFYHREGADHNSLALFTVDLKVGGASAIGAVMPARARPFNRLIPSAWRPASPNHDI